MSNTEYIRLSHCNESWFCQKCICYVIPFSPLDNSDLVLFFENNNFCKLSASLLYNTENYRCNPSHNLELSELDLNLNNNQTCKYFMPDEINSE